MAGSGDAHLRDPRAALLRIEDLVVEFAAGRRAAVQAVSGVSIDVLPGETLGLVGESGCGKSTTGLAALQLVPPSSGRVIFDGVDLTSLSEEEVRRKRTDLQMIFQDPVSSLNPRRRVGEIVAEPLRVWGTPAGRSGEQLVTEMLDAVGLEPGATMAKRPHEFSGGQCQRISIARSLMLEPKLVICDEPVSALDVSVQAHIINLLEDLKARYDLTLVFIAHDLAVVKNVSDRVAVMYLGKLCEVADSDRLYAAPAHPYTELLLGSSPVPDPTIEIDDTDVDAGELPSPVDPPSGCRFRTRCPLADDRCASEEPQMRPVGDDHHVACHHPLIENAEQPVSLAAP